jgi:hypothetical protein
MSVGFPNWGYNQMVRGESDLPSSQRRPLVSRSFSEYEPPFDPVPIVQHMINSVPEKYLMLLREVVLTNASGLTRKRRRSVTKARGRTATRESMSSFVAQWKDRIVLS